MNRCARCTLLADVVWRSLHVCTECAYVLEDYYVSVEMRARALVANLADRRARATVSPETIPPVFVTDADVDDENEGWMGLDALRRVTG